MAGPRLAVCRQPKKCFWLPLARKNFPLTTDDWLLYPKLEWVRPLWQVTIEVVTFRPTRLNFGDILDLLAQVVSKEFSCHCCRRWAKVFVIRVQVRFYELFPFIIKLGICICQKRKAVYCLLSEHFPAFYLINSFQDGISDASKSCHAP